MASTELDRELDAVAALLWVREVMPGPEIGPHARSLRRAIDHLLGTVPSIDWTQMARLVDSAAKETTALPSSPAEVAEALHRAWRAAEAAG